MVAGAGERRRFHLAQERVHFLWVQAPARSDRAVATHPRQDRVQASAEGACTRIGAIGAFVFETTLAERIEDIGDEGSDRGAGESGRYLPHEDGARAERLEREAQAVEIGGRGDEALRLAGSHLHHVGNQQALTGNAAPCAFAFQPFIDQALVGGMLIDEDKTIVITTHQVEEVEHILTDVLFIRDGRIVLDAPMDTLAERYTEVLVDADRLDAARALQPLDQRSLPFGKTVMLFDGVPRAQLQPLGDTRTPGLADLFVATMKGTYA